MAQPVERGSGSAIGGSFGSRPGSFVGPQQLPARDRHCRPDRQLQCLAQCHQICVAWPRPTLLPKIDGRLADAGTLSNMGNRQAAFDTGVV